MAEIGVGLPIENLTVDVAEPEEQKKQKEEKRGLRGDYLNLCLLVFLYILEGLPIGLLVSIPMILASNKVSYEEQAIFTLSTYPYALKLLWAPIIDSVFSSKFGRRKSWLVPVQYLIGLTMIAMAYYSEKLIGSKTVAPNIYLLTATFFFLLFLVATQDVAVDGWALTLLAKRNVHYASSSNAVGVILGIFVSNTLFLSLESEDFCNKYLRKKSQQGGIITIADFFNACGAIFIISTTLLWLLKRENDDFSEEENNVKGVCKTYKSLWGIMRLRSVKILAIIMLTQYIGSAGVENVTGLKMIQFGMKRENLALLAMPINFLNIFLPFIIVNKAKHNPIKIYYLAGVLKLAAGCGFVAITYWTQTLHITDGNFPIHYYVTVFFVFLVYDLIRFAMGMAIWAFKTKIADPKIGATYMTLLTTLNTIGSRWTGTLSVWLIDILSFTVPFGSKHRSNSTVHAHSPTSGVNSTFIGKNHRTYFIDGYYVEFVICFVLGLLWLKIFRPYLMNMQSWPETEWRYTKEKVTKF
ncbi:acetyl-coenzyme A transporter 1-like protein [Dinothrombium tinctorium]|uniref:Acetyl-coenzyme A transporter 1-like protein n=1 Tax=Dinothrombium tinctorium TaxID=1965070 RepID=A0A3S3P0T4_9ACAR|nr:acetyl-coenzyme A transporter 1-like protein [Dinothrombium tinctorium]